MNEEVLTLPFQVKIADSFFKRLKGLMFSRNPIKDEGLWIVPCNAVHMFFMRFPIDVVLIDERNKIVRLYPNLKPWRMTKPVKNAYSTLELPVGTIEKLGIKIGFIINFQTQNK